MGIRGTRAGAVTFVQRFGSALNLNVHFHCVVADGIWVRQEGSVQLLPLPGLTDEDVTRVLRCLERRIRALLKPKLDALEEDARPPDSLAASQAESVSALRGKPPDRSETKHLAAYHKGFSLHAGVHLHATDRQEIVPAPSQSPCPRPTQCSSDAPGTTRPPPTTQPSRPLDSRIPWKELLLRVFRENILACPCGGRREVIAFIHETPVIDRILRHLGLATTGPPTAPARLPARAETWLWQDDVPELQRSLR